MFWKTGGIDHQKNTLCNKFHHGQLIKPGGTISLIPRKILMPVWCTTCKLM